MEKILLININDTDIKKTNDVFVRLRIRTDIVKPEFYGCTLGELASGNASAKPAGAPFGESIVVMCGLRDKRLDAVVLMWITKRCLHRPMRIGDLSSWSGNLEGKSL
mgnify:CR=1 FL=1